MECHAEIAWYTLKYYRNIISHMSICKNWLNIQCIIVLVIINISFNQTQSEINKTLWFFFKRTYATIDSIIFFDFVTLSDPSCASVNKTLILSGFLLCASSKWWEFKPLPAIFYAIVPLSTLLSTFTRFYRDEKFIFTWFWLFQVSNAQKSENVQCLSKFTYELYNNIAWLLKSSNYVLQHYQFAFPQSTRIQKVRW